MSTPLRRVLAVVPARGGSKGVPGKNLADVGGVSLLGHAIAFAASVPRITRCVVSTDDAGIAAAARELDADVPFLRPVELAGDQTPMAPVLRHALGEIERHDGDFDAVVLLMPTTPVRRSEHLSAALALLESSDADGVISVSEPPFHPAFVGVREQPEGTLARYLDVGAGLVRRQDADRFLRITGQFYVWRSAFVRRMERSWLDEGRHLAIETDDADALDVDTAEDLDRLRKLVAAGLVTLPRPATSRGRQL